MPMTLIVVLAVAILIYGGIGLAKLVIYLKEKKKNKSKTA